MGASSLGPDSIFRVSSLKRQLRDDWDEARNAVEQLNQEDFEESDVSELMDPLLEDHETTPIHLDLEAAEKRQAEWNGTKVVEIRIPYSGPRELFQYQPSSRSSAIPRVELTDEHVILRYDTDRNSGEEIQRTYDRQKKALQDAVDASRKDVKGINSQLGSRLEDWLGERKAEVETDEDIVEGLDL